MKILPIYFLLSLLVPISCFSQKSNIEKGEEFTKALIRANAFYNDAHYDSSIYLYEKLEESAQNELNLSTFFDYKIRMIFAYLNQGDYSNANKEFVKAKNLIREKKYSDFTDLDMLNYLDGEIQYKSGKYDLAQKALTHCLNNINHSNRESDSLRVLVLKSLGNIKLKHKQASEALEIYLKAIEIEKKRRKKSDPLIGSLYLNLALAFDQLKKFDSADFYFMKSFDIKSEYSKNKDLLAASYANYSNYLIKFGKTEKALFYLTKADSIYRNKHGDNYFRLAFIHLTFAKIYMLNSDNRKALNYFIKSEKIYRQYLSDKDSKFENIEANIALLYKYLSKYEKSIEIYNSDILKNSINKSTQIIRLRNIGECNLRLGNITEAGNYFQQALNQSIDFFGDFHIQTATCYLSYSSYFSNIGDKENTEKCLYQALQFFIGYYGKNNREVTNVYNNYSINSFKIGNFENAAKKAQHAIISITPEFTDTSIFSNPSFDQLQNDYHAIVALTLKTNALAELMLVNSSIDKYADKALETALLGIKLFENFKSTLGEENSQLYNTEKINILFQYAILSSWQVFQNTGDQSYLDLAFQLSEKNKATILSSGMNQFTNGLNNYVPDSIILQERNIKQELRTYNGLIHEENNKPIQDSIKINWLQNKMFDKRLELDTFMNYLVKNYNKYYELKNSRKVASINEIQGQLNNNEVLLEYALTEKTLFIFAIKANDHLSVKIDLNKNFRNIVSDYLAILHQPPDFNKYPEDLMREYSNLSFAIYETLITPIEHFIQENDLIIIPDELLGYIPFESLLTEPYNKTFSNFRVLPYLLKKCALSYHYSSTLYINQEDANQPGQSSKALVMAPVYRNNKTSISSHEDENLEYLKFTIDEAEIIHKAMGGKLFLDSIASEVNFKNNASDYSILHLAMHTRLDDENPLSSKLIFSPPTDSIEDGYLNTYEIYDLKLNADLVVLSACETGSGKLRKGEGIMSMARGFLFAGVPSLLITHWKVNDAASSIIMQKFYSYLESGKRNALQKAKLEYIANSDQVFSHPYYWSAFVLIGDNSPIIKSNSTYYYYIILLIIIFGVISFVVLKRKA